MISLSVRLRMINFSGRGCRVNLSTHFVFSSFLFKNPAVCEIMWKNIVEPDRQQMTIWRMHIACWILKGYKHTLWIRSTYCFSTATMMARTHLNVSYTYIASLNSCKWPAWRTITLLYDTFITVLYMFRATSCSSSGGQIVLIHHLV